MNPDWLHNEIRKWQMRGLLMPELAQAKQKANGHPTVLPQPASDIVQGQSGRQHGVQNAVSKTMTTPRSITGNQAADQILLRLLTLPPFQLIMVLCTDLGISGKQKADAIDALKEVTHLISLYPLPTGLRGKKPLCTELCEQAYRQFGLPVPRELHIGKAGKEHRALQHLGARKIPGAEIELNASGKNLDIGFRKNGELHALEIQTSLTHVIPNIQKDLAAGVSHIAMLFTKAADLKKAKALITRELLESERARVECDVVGNWI